MYRGCIIIKHFTVFVYKVVVLNGFDNDYIKNNCKFNKNMKKTFDNERKHYKEIYNDR